MPGSIPRLLSLSLLICLTFPIAPWGAAVAQRGGAAGQRGQTPSRPASRDSANVRKTPAGFVLDFQDQPLRVVLSAIAEAGGLNVSLSNIPSKNVTVRMGQSMSRDSMSAIVRGLAQANGLTVTQIGPLMSIVGVAEPTSIELAQQNQQRLLQQFQQTNQQASLKLFTYRLKHANAVQLAPILTNLFVGSVGFGTGGGGIQFINPNTGAVSNINVNPFNGAVQGITTINGRAGAAGAAAAGISGAGGAPGRGGFGNAGAAAPVNPNVNPLAAFGGLQQQLAPGALSAQAGQIRIVAEDATNTLLVRATDTDWALVQQILQGIDLRPLQVLIEVTIAEVTRTHDLDVGVTGTVARKRSNGADSLISQGSASSSSANDFILALTGGHGSINYNVALSALQTRGNVRVLSLPVIIAQNNKQAVLNVGQSVPFVQVSQSVITSTAGVVQTVQYQDVGTTLTITPTINPDGYVNMAVSQTDNSATNAIQFDAPIISKREATTQIFIHDGQTTVIGGLAGNTRNHTTSGIPILSSIPFIGPLLFGHITQNDEATELFLFLTPHVISSDDDIDRLREAVKNHSELLKSVPVGPNIVPAPDTMRVPLDTFRRLDSLRRIDSLRRTDSLTLLRRRPPAIRRDTTVTPLSTPTPAELPRPSRTEPLAARIDDAGREPWRLI
jgi:type II secretion system protein D